MKKHDCPYQSTIQLMIVMMMISCAVSVISDFMLWAHVTQLVTSQAAYTATILLVTAARAQLCRQTCARSAANIFALNHSNLMAQPRLIVFDLGKACM